MSSHIPIENTLMNNFEAESRSILLNYRASLNNNFDTNEESLEKALSALTQLHQQETLKVIGEDENHIVVDNGVAIDSCDSYKTGNEADCNCPAGERNQFRNELRTNLNNTKQDNIQIPKDYNDPIFNDIYLGEDMGGSN